MYNRSVVFCFAFLIIGDGLEVICGDFNSVDNAGTVSDSVGTVGRHEEWLIDVTGVASGGNETRIEEPRKTKTQPSLMERILPMMLTPFLVSTSMIPMMLISILVMLVKSAFIGKIGIVLLLISMLRSRSSSGGFFTHNVDVNNRQGEGMDLAMEHYGYHGDEEYGAYINRRRKRK